MSHSLRYSFLLGVQVFLVVADLFFNALSEFAKAKPEVQLVLFVFQDVLIVVSLTVTFVSFFSTYVFQAGLVGLLFDRFRLTILTSILYLLFTISLHIWLLTERWSRPREFNWSASLTAYFVCQKMMSPLYYYSTKRALLRISDPRFYQNPTWVTDKIIRDS